VKAPTETADFHAWWTSIVVRHPELRLEVPTLVPEPPRAEPEDPCSPFLASSGASAWSAPTSSEGDTVDRAFDVEPGFEPAVIQIPRAPVPENLVPVREAARPRAVRRWTLVGMGVTVLTLLGAVSAWTVARAVAEPRLPVHAGAPR
jgi:hypothetical protein